MTARIAGGGLTHLSLFSGIGGIDLAAEWAGFETVGQCEWADYPTKVLEKHWPSVPRWRDIRTLTKESFYERTGLRTVDIISGGFPCQPFSTAGKREGKNDNRFLWPEMLRVISEIRPRWVIGENVAGIVSMELDRVLSDLEAIDYTVQAFIIPACAVDAPHRRDRCVIVAHTDNRFSIGEENEIQAGRTTIDRRRKNVAHTYGERLQIRRYKPEVEAPFTENRVEYSGDTLSDTHDRGGTVRRSRELQAAQGFGKTRPDHRGGTPEHGLREWWTTEPDVGRVAYGVPNRVDRLKGLGNAVVPPLFFHIFRAIYEIEKAPDA